MARYDRAMGESSRPPLGAAIFGGASHGILGVLVFVGALIVVPNFSEIYADFGATLPGTTRVTLALAQFLTRYALLAFPLGVALLTADIFVIAQLTRISRAAAIGWIVFWAVGLIAFLATTALSLYVPFFELSAGV